jgi:hypothetical protein
VGVAGEDLEVLVEGDGFNHSGPGFLFARDHGRRVQYIRCEVIGVRWEVSGHRE